MTKPASTAAALKHAVLRHDPFRWSWVWPFGSVDHQGWNGAHPALTRLVAELRPKIILDIGVWKGQSTLTLAQALRDQGLDGAVIAIDTWLGSPEHWNPERTQFGLAELRLKRGYPRLYEVFRRNVVRSRLSDYVVPLPQTSLNAAEILRRCGTWAQLIHVDAAHDYDNVLADCRAYWDLLDRGGVMIGDDYADDWPGVRAAADTFCREVGVSLQVDHPKWIARKP
jgi:hypothetical protein